MESNAGHGATPPEALRAALLAGDLAGVSALEERGADLGYRRADGGDALIDAAHGPTEGMLEMLRLLVARGVPLSGISAHGDSALRVLSRRGCFDGVRLLLDAGADESQLEWTPLIRATALCEHDEMRRLIDEGADLEARDLWSRSAWLVAVLAGDRDAAELLLDRGADPEATGRCARPPLFFAIEGRQAAMLSWLIGLGLDPEQTDAFGGTALMEASERGFTEAVDVLVAAGVEIDRERSYGGTALASSQSRPVIVRLLDAGADPAELSHEGGRALVGLPAEPDDALLDGVSPREFKRARTRRFGRRNPDPMDEPFWLAMIRAGSTAHAAGRRFGGATPLGGEPIWCARRFGQSLTRLPDGRIVAIAGEHEDGYDPDFCIYNDVVVHDPDGTMRIYGYPEAVFPPTDFHTATLCGDAIVIVGSLGYPGTRRYGETPVHRLDVRSWRIERVDVRGTAPGWISRHRAELVAPGRIRISGGQIQHGPADGMAPNDAVWTLDLDRRRWGEEAAGPGG